jgi:RNA polymerase primary sigma factor
LPFREKEIIKMRYDIKDGKEKTLEEVGNVFKISRERIRQIESKALNKLRNPLKCRQLKDYLNDI